MTGVYVLEANWSGDSDYSDSYENLTTYLREVRSYERGKGADGQPVGRGVPGHLSAVLYNPDGLFTRTNASSPLYGLLKRGTPVRLRMTSPTSATLWTGYLQRIIPSSPRGGAQTALLTATGILAQLAQLTLSTGQIANQAPENAVEQIMTRLGLLSSYYAARVYGATYNFRRWYMSRRNVLDELRDLEATEVGMLGETADGKVLFEERPWRLMYGQLTAKATWTDAGGGTLSYEGIDFADEDQGLYNQDVESSAPGYTVGASATLWQHFEVGTANFFLEPGEVREFWATYPGAGAAANADHVDAWTTTTATTDVLANSQADGLGTNLTGNITIGTGLNYAREMKIVLTNAGATRAYITKLQARGTPVTRSDRAEVQVDDATSQAAYGLTSYPVHGPYYADLYQARVAAEHIVLVSKDPHPNARVAMVGGSDALLTEFATRDISERIRLVANRTGAKGTNFGINADYTVENMVGSIGLDKVHRMVYTVAPCVLEPSLFYRLEEASGTRAPSVGSLSLTDVNTVTQATGRAGHGHAAQFTAANEECLTHAHNTLYSPRDTAWSVCAWVYLTDKSVSRTIACKGWGRTNHNEWTLEYNQGPDRFLFQVSPGGTGSGVVYAKADAEGSPSINTWYWVCGMHDPVNNLISIRIGKSGTDAPRNVNYTSFSGGVYAGGSGDFVVGAGDTSPGRADPWDGRIDSLGIFPYLLPEAQMYGLTGLFGDGAEWGE